MTEEQIFDIIDGTADAATLAQHQTLWATDAAYRAKFQRLENLENQLQSLDLDAPSMRFTQNLMEHVAPPPRKTVADNVGRAYAWASAAFLAIIFVFLAKTANGFSVSKTLEETAVLDRWIGLALSSQILQISSILVVFMLLYFFDIKVLKPYFSGKNEKNTAI